MSGAEGGRSRPLVDFLVIGAMKCGTTSLHRYLSRHPSIALPPEKEVNFFFGDRPGGPGQFWRGPGWYESRFPPGSVRGDVSPGCTSPDHPGVARRIASVAPRAKLLYVVRDPLARAVSQYRHHRRDGTEHRSMAEALPDPGSHYVLRSRYADRLDPFLQQFPDEQVAVIDHDDLRRDTAATVAAICRFLGLGPDIDEAAVDRRFNRAGSPPPPVPDDVARAFRGRIADDADRFLPLCERLRLRVSLPS